MIHKEVYLNTNDTRNVIINQDTGEIHEENFTKKRGKLYHWPRKYWRLMELYDKAQLLLGSKVGIQIMIFLKQYVDVDSFRIQINQTWIAEDLKTSKQVINRNLKKLIDNGYIIKEKRNIYFVNPDMFWISGMDDKRWQELKQEYKYKLEKSKS